MYKKCKRLVYTPSDLLARICKVNLSNAKKCGLICFPRICFRGLIYCGQEPLWLLNVTEDVCYFLGVHTCISTRCKMFHSKITYPFPQKSHECALKLTDLWITSLLFRGKREPIFNYILSSVVLSIWRLIKYIPARSRCNTQYLVPLRDHAFFEFRVGFDLLVRRENLISFSLFSFCAFANVVCSQIYFVSFLV